MTKVEELRDSINSRFSYGALLEPLNDLIAAAEAQGEAKGRAEGAEAERERIRSKSDFCSANTSASFFENVYLVPASLLATATKSVPSATVTNHDGPVTSTDCSIENAGYVQASDKEPK